MILILFLDLVGSVSVQLFFLVSGSFSSYYYLLWTTAVLLISIIIFSVKNEYCDRGYVFCVVSCGIGVLVLLE